MERRRCVKDKRPSGSGRGAISDDRPYRDLIDRSIGAALCFSARSPSEAVHLLYGQSPSPRVNPRRWEHSPVGVLHADCSYRRALDDVIATRSVHRSRPSAARVWNWDLDGPASFGALPALWSVAPLLESREEWKNAATRRLGSCLPAFRKSVF